MIKVNLLSPEKKDLATAPAEAAAFVEDVPESKINTTAIIAATVITVAVIGTLYFTQSRTLDNKRAYLAERKARKTELDGVLQTLEQLEKTNRDLEKRVKVISDLKARQKQTVFMMDEMSRVLPDWVWLTKMSFSGGVVTVSGRALTNNLIADFINNLQSTNHFTNIRLNSSKRTRVRGQDFFDFSINCRYHKAEEKKAV